MSVTVRLSTPFREVTGGKGEVAAEGTSLEELFRSLEAAHPGFRELVFDESGAVQRHAHISVNGDDYRALGGLQAALKSGDVVSVLFAISGG